MRAGELTEQITIRRIAAQAEDGAGGRANTWADYLTGLWAKIEPQGGRLAIREGRLGDAPTYLVTLRWPVDVTVADRIVWNGRTYIIREAVPQPARADRITLVIEEFNT